MRDHTGMKYVYTVDEVKVPEEFEKSISKDGLTITNTIKPTNPERPKDPTSPNKPSKPNKPNKPSDPTKPGKPIEDGDLVQTGTDVNILIPIGFIIMLIGVAYVYKDKLIKR